jgi:hypothetical protein
VGVNRVFRALPAYFGGKRRLLGPIFRGLPSAGDAPTFVDPFLGGGAVSLYAKARGYRVVCNDLAERSAVVGKALIENDRVTLTHDDLVRLCVHQYERHFARDHLAPDTFPVDHAAFLDTILANADEMDGPKRWLANLLAVKYALRLRPMGNFGAKTVVKQAAAGDWEDMNPHYVKDLVQRGLPRHPIRVAEEIRRQISQGGICYMDPPYAGTQSYESALRPLDELLAGRSLKPAANPFSRRSPEEVLPPLFEAADHIPVWVVSYGNARIDLAGLMDLVRRYRPRVEGRAIRYTHCTGLAGEESRQRNRELLVIGRKS